MYEMVGLYYIIIVLLLWSYLAWVDIVEIFHRPLQCDSMTTTRTHYALQQKIMLVVLHTPFTPNTDRE